MCHKSGCFVKMAGLAGTFEPALQVPKAAPLTQLDSDNECGDSLRSGKLAKEPDRQQTCDARAIRFIEERLANLQKIGSYTVISMNRASKYSCADVDSCNARLAKASRPAA
jgi:hypothetical protein